MILIVAAGIALSCLFLITVFWLRQRAMEHQQTLLPDLADDDGEETFTGTVQVVDRHHVERETAEQRAWAVARKIAERHAWDLARELAEERK